MAAVLGGEQHRAAGDLDVGQELAEHLERGGALVVEGLGHARGQAVGELELGLRPERALVREVLDDPTGANRVVDDGAAVHEQALAGHLDVVEDHERVLLV